MNNFNPTLATDLDWVRFLVGDIAECEQVSDETIEAMLAQATIDYKGGTWNRYWVAAMILDAMLIGWRARNGGVSKEEVSRLKLEYGGTGGNMDAMLGEKAKQYRIHAAWLMYPRPRLMAII